jgi:nitrogen fixation-related uncharacterized protein
LKQAEQAFQIKLKELDISLDEMAVNDRASARNMEVATHSLMPAILTGVVGVVFGVVLWGSLSGQFDPKANPDAAGMIETLKTVFVACTMFWVGTTRGSQSKDVTISALSRS